MPWPTQNQQALKNLFDDLLTNFEVSNLCEAPYENDSMQYHEEFEKENAARG